MKIHLSERHLISHYDTVVDYASFGWEAIQGVAEKLDINLDIDWVLDLGCGRGEQLKHFKNSVGIDFSLERIKVARGNSDNSFICQDIYEYLERVEPYLKFNLILLFEVLEHLEEPEEVIRMAKKLGPIFGSVPLDMPYIAHLQLFKTVQEVVERFRPDRWIVGRSIVEHVFFYIKGD